MMHIKVVTRNNSVYFIRKGADSPIRVRRADSGLGESFGTVVGEVDTVEEAIALIEEDGGSDINSVDGEDYD
jgi:hypothetical protein